MTAAEELKADRIAAEVIRGRMQDELGRDWRTMLIDAETVLRAYAEHGEHRRTFAIGSCAHRVDIRSEAADVADVLAVLAGR